MFAQDLFGSELKTDETIDLVSFLSSNITDQNAEWRTLANLFCEVIVSWVGIQTLLINNVIIVIDVHALFFSVTFYKAFRKFITNNKTIKYSNQKYYTFYMNIDYIIESENYIFL